MNEQNHYDLTFGGSNKALMAWIGWPLRTIMSMSKHYTQSHYWIGNSSLPKLFYLETEVPKIFCTLGKGSMIYIYIYIYSNLDI
jgi:hypothetical protein